MILRDHTRRLAAVRKTDKVAAKVVDEAALLPLPFALGQTPRANGLQRQCGTTSRIARYSHAWPILRAFEFSLRSIANDEVKVLSCLTICGPMQRSPF